MLPSSYSFFSVLQNSALQLPEYPDLAIQAYWLIFPPADFISYDNALFNYTLDSETLDPDAILGDISVSTILIPV